MSKYNQLNKFLTLRIRDKKTLDVALELLDSLNSIARGTAESACTEKKAQAYMGSVCLAREGIDSAFLATGEKI